MSLTSFFIFVFVSMALLWTSNINGQFLETTRDGTTTTSYSPPTPAPTHCECLSYTADNSSWISPDGDSCEYCYSCSAGVCNCLSKPTCDEIADAVKSFFGWIVGAIATVIVLAILGCIYRCCIRPRLKKAIKSSLNYQQQINDEESHDHHHHEHHEHAQPVVMTQPVMVPVDQYGRPVQMVYAQQPQVQQPPPQPMAMQMHATSGHQ
mmetsp:Transcript_46225/g.74118  ORF Transcript_46225/g.74118 Transcript_46225/m.74118 type:complete len:208 (-) Transcript_46225:309-932(-)|eukprot:CAMPEP_0197020756 /NCGR_PEP_ID=MMETSP1384-20130603/1642_1 /TAXON_ID=29189 /ORGANISM="Ammonia sp." /LENGTH=207 /DNA_ID=CAMNT_0042448445 /DNA_START=118 /DNA_END=741 /DNA_ORIENTATION=-